MIRGINLRLLRNAELLQFLEYIIAVVQQSNPTVLRLDAKLVTLQNIYNTLDTLFKLPQDSLLTIELQELDAKRDLYISGISKFIEAHFNHFDPTYVAAAKLLDRNLTMYGSQIYNMNYQAQSTTITNIITDWNTQESLAEAVTLLGLRDWKDELSNTNSSFIERYKERSDEYSAESLDKIKQKRIESYAAYYALRDLILSYANIDESNPNYQELIRKFNTYVDQFNTLLNTRKGKKDEEK